MKKKQTVESLFADYVRVVRRLRKECPWDREQTHQSIRHSLIEEAYEVVESIDHKNMDDLKLELGDLLLHVVLHSIMAEEESAFTIETVVAESSAKLIRRHPHVFGNTKVRDSKDVLNNWEKIKLSEGRKSLMDGVPKKMPSLLRAHRLQEKASKVGFDWKRKDDVWKKVVEEIDELHGAERQQSHDHLEEEFGDLLFALVNYARFIKVNPESALSKSTKKFTKRFQRIEEEMRKRGKKLEHSTLEEMDALWDEGKALERKRGSR
ncbi:MAG TPA: nucleoside triphosphate pyrophosphohydrolase [Bacteroidota bacterium]|nr:nucleoside triphosphate pyrophosphohydrolase [Bacteroidota bacterium]